MINLLQTLRQQRRIGITQRQLRGLSDHLLSDIGLSRGDIDMVGRNGLPRGRRGDVA